MALYYFGAMIIIFAFTYFLVSQWETLSSWTVLGIALGFQALCFGMGYYLRYKLQYRISGGLLTTAAASITPLAIYSLERIFGVWPADAKGMGYSDYWRWIRPCWVYMELATLMVAFIALYRARFSLIMLVIGHTLWFLSMDIVGIILGTNTNYGEPSWEARRWVSIVISAAMIGVAKLLNRRTREDYSLWLFIYGGLIFMTAGAFTWLDHEAGALIYLATQIMFIVMSVKWQRTSLMVFGALGFYIYLAHLAYDLFKNSPFFPIALALIGLLMILGTVSFQRQRFPKMGDNRFTGDCDKGSPSPR
ncbi:MAG: hypothetical protein A3G87_04655 [Omnitrophica bacterium RIFCSPLOWO2_12_FULL_50_11]|nr:MAG: hypothetical protein A3G87_04655 [Omnitrophica bacterium RIFCSPLOWO2_12_FULL_50_11]